MKGKGGSITWAPNHFGDTEIMRGRQKIPIISHVHSSVQYICFRKTSGSKIEALNLHLAPAPSNLVTPLSIFRLVPSRNPSTHFYVAKLRCRQTANSRTALAIALKLVFRFHFGGLQNIESVIVVSFPHCIPIFTAAFPFPSRAVNRHFKE